MSIDDMFKPVGKGASKVVNFLDSIEPKIIGLHAKLGDRWERKSQSGRSRLATLVYGSSFLIAWGGSNLVNKLNVENITEYSNNATVTFALGVVFGAWGAAYTWGEYFGKKGNSAPAKKESENKFEKYFNMIMNKPMEKIGTYLKTIVYGSSILAVSVGAYRGVEALITNNNIGYTDSVSSISIGLTVFTFLSANYIVKSNLYKKPGQPTVTSAQNN